MAYTHSPCDFNIAHHTPECLGQISCHCQPLSFGHISALFWLNFRCLCQCYSCSDIRTYLHVTFLYFFSRSFQWPSYAFTFCVLFPDLWSAFALCILFPDLWSAFACCVLFRTSGVRLRFASFPDIWSAFALYVLLSDICFFEGLQRSSSSFLLFLVW